jgi:hypothetical protein
MPTSLDSYIETVIKVGDEGSALLARLCAPTLRNNCFVEVLSEGMNGIAGMRFPEKIRYSQIFEYMFIISKGIPKTINITSFICSCWCSFHVFTITTLGIIILYQMSIKIYLPVSYNPSHQPTMLTDNLMMSSSIIFFKNN